MLKQVKYDTKILGKGSQCRFNSDPFVSGLNNNEFVVGGPGSGKTTSIVEPNLLHMRNGNAVVVLTKIGRSDIIKQGLREHGYRIFEINFAHPEKSAYGYDPLTYCHTDADVRVLAHSIVHAGDYDRMTGDPYWADSAENLIQLVLWYVAGGHYSRGRRMQDALYLLDSLVWRNDMEGENFGLQADDTDYFDDYYAAYLRNEKRRIAEGRSYHDDYNLDGLPASCNIPSKGKLDVKDRIREDREMAQSYLYLKEMREKDPLYFEFRKYLRQLNKKADFYWKNYLSLPETTGACVTNSVQAPLKTLFTDDVCKILENPKQFDFAELLQPKTVLFVHLSPVSTAQNRFVGFFYNQLFQSLFEMAEEQPDYVLPYPLQVVCDDFATSAPIPDFDAKISIMREKRIGVTLLVQSESQLEAMYGRQKAVTIINGCDTYLYFGGMNIETCKSMSQRMNLPYDEVQSMPVGQEFIIRRGQKPIITERYSVFDDPIYQKLINSPVR